MVFLDTFFRDRLREVSTLAVVCNQWGDSGKGKIVDVLAEWAEIVVRGNGGPNAGHTLVIDGREYILHMAPVGIIRDRDGIESIIGNGVAFDPRSLTEELAFLDRGGLPHNHLRIAYNAKLILPQHIVMDRVGESRSGGEIGTTGRGVGPVYTDHVARRGLRVNDMLNPNVFAQKLRRNLEDKVALLRSADPEIVRQVMQHPHLLGGAFYSPTAIFDIDAIVDAYTAYGKHFRDVIMDTDVYLRSLVGKRKILLEGAQGLLLSIDHGSYPYVTSSDCSASGLANGAGLSDGDVDVVYGIAKAFYMTRVGEGPFPTEFGRQRSAAWCKTHKREDEEAAYSSASVNDPDEFTQGVAIRRVGREYGATTGRPRRTGWLDLPLLRHAAAINLGQGDGVVLSKVDVLDDCDTIRICEAYDYQGPDYSLGERTLHVGMRLDVAPPDSFVLSHCQPVYKEFSGWRTPIADARSYDALPGELRAMVDYVERRAGVHVAMISVGPEREQILVKE